MQSLKPKKKKKKKAVNGVQNYTEEEPWFWHNSDLIAKAELTICRKFLKARLASNKRGIN